MQFSLTGRADLFRSILLFTFTGLLFLYSSASPQISDKSVLLELKAALSDPEGVLSSWISTNSSDDLGHCSWNGVVCGPNSRVSAIAIVGGGKRESGGNWEKVPCFDVSKFPFYGFGIRRACSAGNGKLSGALPSVISKLTEIRVLSLPFHGLDGEIPSEVWGLRNLEVLDLEGNSLTGNLPVSFEGLRKLRVLNLGLNEIDGEIPDSLSKCMQLKVLNLAGNRFRGPVPRFIGIFSELSGLHLSSNSLEGTIPVELGHNCKNLQYLDLSRNAFTGEIPLELGNCQQLRALLLFSNQLQGFMPNTFGQLRMLEVLDVSRNSLSGPVPPELGNCINLSVLVLSRLYDPLPSTVNIQTNSTELSGSSNGESNSFHGTIPEEVSALARLKVLWAPAASLKGEFPRSWGKGLEVINLSQNFFTGGIKDVFRGCENLRFVDLSTNKLTGQLDGKLSVPCMIVFDVSRNMFSGSIPRFRNGVCQPVVPQVSELEQLGGPSNAYLSFLTSEDGVNDPTLNAKLAVVHNFGHNNFTGVIPSLPIADSRLVNIADYAFLADGNKLTGIFPGRLFDSCHKLNGMFVDVSNNRLSGRVPVGLSAMCRSLKFLDASGNKISGFVPRRHGNMESLVLLDLSLRDGLTEIPVNLGRLNYLYYYNLSKNRLHGGLPYRLRQLPSVKISGISPSSLVIDILLGSSDLRNLTALVFNINELSVKIRSGLSEGNSLSASRGLTSRALLEANSVNCSSAFGSCHILDNSSTSYSSVQSSPEDLQPDPLTSASSYGGGNKFNSIEIASIVSASAIVLVLLALIVLFIYTRKYAPKGGSRVQVLEKKEITVFIDIGVSLTFPNIVKATECFSTRNCIGSGGFGSTYRAEVSPGVSVAVKRLAVGRVHCVQQFHAEIKTLGRIRHNNLVTLIGYHASETEMFLIYNYLPGGNLEKFIQDRPTRPVNWKVLHKIALDIAHALAYLHDSCDPRVIHRDVKPSNVLLDNNFNAYLSDFGLSRLLGNSETHATTGVEGTFGYLAPEYAMTCRVSEKADVYSYGVVLLELISDKRALDPSFSAHGDGFNIVSWACMLLRQGRAKEVFTAGLWDSGPRDDLVEVLHLAVKCTLETLSIRPTMKQVVQRLKQLRPVS